MRTGPEETNPFPSPRRVRRKSALNPPREEKGLSVMNGLNVRMLGGMYMPLFFASDLVGAFWDGCLI